MSQIKSGLSGTSPTLNPLAGGSLHDTANAIDHTYSGHNYSGHSKSGNNKGVNHNDTLFYKDGTTIQFKFPTYNGKRDLDHPSSAACKDRNGKTVYNMTFKYDKNNQLTGGTIRNNEGQVKPLSKANAAQFVGNYNHQRQKQAYNLMSKDTDRYQKHQITNNQTGKTLTTFKDTKTGKQYIYGQNRGQKTPILEATLAKNKNEKETLRMYDKNGLNAKTYYGTSKEIRQQVQKDYPNPAQTKAKAKSKSKPKTQKKAQVKQMPMRRPIRSI